ncbi:MAG: Trk family potassium uptake protein [Clostridia bacterium]|nr:Trk family potassium uptake protein [Clostridia bacterium]
MKYKKTRLNAPLKVIISFVAVILVGSLLLSLPIASKDGKWFSYIDALFTSTSAVCVTGLSVVDTAVHFSLFGQIVIMFLIQIGGIGFISLSALFLLAAGKRLGYKNRVMLQESLNQDTSQGMVVLIKKIAKIVLIIEGVGFVCLLPSMIVSYGWLNGMFKALFLSISAFCNAGFDVLGTTGTEFSNLAPFARAAYVLLPIMFLIVLGGIGYATIVEVAGKFGKGKQKRKLTLQAKIILSMSGILILSGAILFAIFEWNNPLTIGKMSVFDKIINSLFQSVTPRTAGFSTFDQANLTSASRVVTDILMFIGGSPGSVAGGVKTTTIFVLFLAAFRAAGEKGDVILNHKRIRNQTIMKALRIVFLTITIAVFATIMLCLIEKDNAAITSSSVIFEVLSAISTVGLTLGVTPTLKIASKMILILLMFIGRVGTITIAFAMRRKSPDAHGMIEYEDSHIAVG